MTALAFELSATAYASLGLDRGQHRPVGIYGRLSWTGRSLPSRVYHRHTIRPVFKHLSRHVGKLLEVIEFVLSSGDAFVSANFYLSNGYVARRNVLLRPIHYDKDLPRQLRDAIAGAKGVHRDALQNFIAGEAG